MVAVTDTGQGMTADIIEKAFEPFFTTKEIGKGSGLGLSMVYGFVKQSNGHIKIYSEVGHGTTIKIYLPKTKNIIKKDTKQDTKSAEITQNSKIILVVEDNREVIKLTSAMVSSLGYHVLEALTGEVALDIIKTRDDIDLLMTDVILSGQLSGPELANLALEIRPDLRVLFNSGYAENAVFKGGFLTEGSNMISKPFRKPQLAAKIRDMLK